MSHRAVVRHLTYAKKQILHDGKPVSFISTEEFSNLFGFRPDYLNGLRISGSHPELRWTRLGKSVRYLADGVVSFVESHTYVTTKEAGSQSRPEVNRARAEGAKQMWKRRRAQGKRRRATRAA